MLIFSESNMKVQITLRSCLRAVVQSLSLLSFVDVTVSSPFNGSPANSTPLQQNDSTCALIPPLFNDLIILYESESESYQ